MVVSGDMMWLCQKKLSPALRLMAAWMILAWLTTTTFCSAHCTGLLDQSQSKSSAPQMSCHGGAMAKACHKNANTDSPQKHSSSASSCLTIQTALFKAPPTPDFTSDSFALYFLATVLPFTESTLNVEAFVGLSESQTRDWIATPQLSLGLAARSLAPPVLALI